jgi:beta-carotene 3-hydroxylase
MADWLLPLLVMLASAAATELLAWAVHKYVMHGWGWGWHRSHHSPRTGWFEKNDLYAVVFAALSILLFSVAADRWPLLWWVGAGMGLYGLLYMLVHDGLVHQRIPFVKAPRRGYLKRLVQAHRLHHAVRAREGAVSFGFLWAPPLARLRAELRGERAP